MTSPKTGPLPIVTPGHIWDGTTEFQDVNPDGLPTVWVCRMYMDRTRRFSESIGTAFPMTALRLNQGYGWKSIGICIDNPRKYIDHESIDYNNDGFLNYDGTVSFDPPNQYFDLLKFKAHAARFAHELDAVLGFHSLKSSDEQDSDIVRQTIAAMVGSAARRYQKWEDIQPEELIMGGEFDGTPLWMHHDRTVQDYKDIDKALCGQCNIANLARQLKKKGDLPAFRSGWRQGLIYGINRLSTPWSPVVFDVVNQMEDTVAEFHDELDGYYQAMIDYYDEVVGAPPQETE